MAAVAAFLYYQVGSSNQTPKTEPKKVDVKPRVSAKPEQEG